MSFHFTKSLDMDCPPGGGSSFVMFPGFPAPPAPPLLPRGTRHSPLCLRFHVCTGAKDGAVPLPRAWSETVVAPPALPPPLLCLAQPLTPDPKVGSPPSELIA